MGLLFRLSVLLLLLLIELLLLLELLLVLTLLRSRDRHESLCCILLRSIVVLDMLREGKKIKGKGEGKEEESQPRARSFRHVQGRCETHNL